MASEKLLKGIDGYNKTNDHYNVQMIINVLMNLNEEEGRKLFPHIKKLLCDSCPIYKEYLKNHR